MTIAVAISLFGIYLLSLSTGKQCNQAEIIMVDGMVDGLHARGSGACNDSGKDIQSKGSSSQRSVEKVRKPGVLGQIRSFIQSKREEASPKTVGERSTAVGNDHPISSAEEPVLSCCAKLREQGIEVFLNGSIKRVAKHVRKNNSWYYKQDADHYRHAVGHLHNAISQAALNDITSRIPECSTFTGNLRVSNRYQPLHDLLEEKCPVRASALSEPLSDFREFVYFLDKEDQKKIYNCLISKLEAPSKSEAITEKPFSPKWV